MYWKSVKGEVQYWVRGCPSWKLLVDFKWKQLHVCIKVDVPYYIFAGCQSLFEMNWYWNAREKKNPFISNNCIIWNRDFENQPSHSDSTEVFTWVEVWKYSRILFSLAFTSAVTWKCRYKLMSVLLYLTILKGHRYYALKWLHGVDCRLSVMLQIRWYF